MARFFAAAATIIILLCAPLTAALAAQDYFFCLNVSRDMLGEPSSAMVVTLEKFCKTLSGNTGKNVRLKKLSNEGEELHSLIKEFRTGGCHITALNAPEYSEAMKYDDRPATPFATFTVDGKPFTSECLYTRKSDGIGKVEQLKGKRWGGRYAFYATHRILLENGFDMPLGDFFGETVYIANDGASNLCFNLVVGAIDVFTANDFDMMFTIKEDPRFSDIVKLTCSEGYHNPIFYRAASMPEADAAALARAFLNAYKDKNFQDFRWIFYTIKGRFVPFEEKKIQRTLEINELYHRQDWIDEKVEFYGSEKKE